MSLNNGMNDLIGQQLGLGGPAPIASTMGITPSPRSGDSGGAAGALGLTSMPQRNVPGASDADLLPNPNLGGQGGTGAQALWPGQLQDLWRQWTTTGAGGGGGGATDLEPGMGGGGSMGGNGGNQPGQPMGGGMGGGGPVPPPPSMGAGQPGAPAGQTYDSLLRDATAAYLASGGSQSNVDAYRAAHTGQNYGQLFNDAAGWWSQQPGGGTGIANYFAAHNPPGSQWNQSLGAAGDMGVAAPPQTLGAARTDSDIGNHPPERPAYPGMTPPAGGASIAPAGSYQGTPGSNAAGGRYSFAQASANNAGQPNSANYASVLNDPARIAQDALAKSQLAAAGYEPYGMDRGPSINPSDWPTQARPAGVGPNWTPPGSTVWNNAGGPTTPGGPNVPGSPGGPSEDYTMAGQEKLNAPVYAAGNTFKNLQGLLDFLRNSTPQSQAFKTQLENKDAQGGSLEPGETSLFTKLSPYLTANATQPPQGATPFTDWSPLSLLKALQTSGLIGNPTPNIGLPPPPMPT